VQAAVINQADARGVFDETHPRFVGVSGFGEGMPAVQIIRQADLVLLVGCDALMKEGLIPLRTGDGADSEAPAFLVELSARAEYDSLFDGVSVKVSGDLTASMNGLLGNVNPLLAPVDEASGMRKSVASWGDEGSGFSEAEIVAEQARIIAENFPREPRPTAELTCMDVVGMTRQLLPPDGMLFTETGIMILSFESPRCKMPAPGLCYPTAGGRTMGLTIPVRRRLLLMLLLL